MQVAGNIGTAPAAVRGAVRSLSPMRGRAVSRVAASVLPDLALAGAIATLIYLLAMFGGPTALFRDADAGWHIRSGEWMLRTHSLPSVDVFSFSKPGAPWGAWEWGADLIVGALNRSFGLAGVAWLYAMLIGASAWMWFRLQWAAGGSFLLACVFAAPMLSTTNLHWLARPHILSWLLIPGTVWALERIPSMRGNRGLWITAAFFAGIVWANLHGSFILGPVAACAYALGTLAQSFLWDDEPGLPQRALDCLLLGGAMSLGSLVNPASWNLHRHVLSYLTDSELLDRIGEFQSFNFHADGATQIALGLMVGILGGATSIAARRPDRFLVAALFSFGALRSARMLPVAALVLLPLANGSITAVLTHAKFSARVRRALDSFLDYGSNLRALDRRMHGLALIPLIALCVALPMRAAAFPKDQFPVNAASTIAALPADARIFSTDKFGGWIIYRFDGSRKVFFDGRSDFYGADFLKDYARMVQARPGWKDQFAKWQFTHALVPAGSTLEGALESAGWQPLYRDKVAVLLKGVNQ